MHTLAAPALDARAARSRHAEVVRPFHAESTRVTQPGRLKIAPICLLVLLIAAAVQMTYYYMAFDKQIIAAHLSAVDAANAWHARMLFFATYVVIIVIGSALYLGLPALLNRMPAYLINIPNPEYWLAPERRAESLARFAQDFYWLGVATLALVLIEMQAALMVSLGTAPHLRGVVLYLPLAVFVVFMVVWLVRVNAMFRKPT